MIKIENKAFFLSGLLLTLVLAFLFFYRSAPSPILSPLPEYLMGSTLVRTLDIWRPDGPRVLGSITATPDLSAKAAYVYDLTTEKALFEKNSKLRLPIASLVKIATAVVALELADSKSTITVSKEAAAIGESSMGISEGEVYTLEDLLYGLMLASGNDAAHAIAEGISGNTSTFVSQMARKAKILGLSDSFYINPSGLEDESQRTAEYSSAYDLVILAKYALTLPRFAHIVQTVEYEIPYTNQHKYLYLFNKTSLLTTYPGVKGIKIGYTDNAGYCLLTYAENGGHRILAVVLGSENARENMKLLLDYSFQTLGVSVPGRM